MGFLDKINDSFKTIFWKIYFVILAFVYISSYVFTLKGIIDSLNLISFTFHILIMIAFFGVIWDKKIFNRLFWKIIFILSITWKIGSIIINAKSTLQQLGLFSFIILYIKIFAFLFPLYFALYLYAFKNEKIWKDGKKRDKLKT